MRKFDTEEKLITYATQAEGLTFGEIDKYGRIKNNRAKGGLGQIIEESYFGYQVNSNAEPDFKELGIELKVTPVRKNKNGTLSAKERLVLNIINYEEEYKLKFFESSFWKNNAKLLIMFYFWSKELERKDFPIIESHLHKYPNSDLEVIKKDWKFIINKIKEGKAHELSEGDTTYLGAVTKGASSKSVRKQPFSSTSAKQRAFSLKQSYMTALVRQLIDNEHLTRITNDRELKSSTLEEIIKGKFKVYFGKSVNQIARDNNIKFNPRAKNFLHMFITHLLKLPNIKLNQIEEFVKANIIPKTIRLEPNGKPRESMSFHNIDFNEWIENDWEDSEWREYFESTKFLFFIFEFKDTSRENAERELYFKGIKLWNMPNKMIEEDLFSFWKRTRDLINDGVVINRVKYGKGYRNENNLPKMSEEHYFHLRPKGTDGKDLISLPDGQLIAKQCFWFNRDFVVDIIKS